LAPWAQEEKNHARTRVAQTVCTPGINTMDISLVDIDFRGIVVIGVDGSGG